MKKFKKLMFGLVLVFVAMSFGGCRLVFEPEVDAVSRLFASMPTGDNRVVRELCDGDDVCDKLTRLAGMIRSDWYANKKDFYEFEEVVIAEDEDMSYVSVKIRLQEESGRDPVMLPLNFKMQRIKFRWHIYEVEGIEEFLRRAERARGIL